MSTGAAMRGDGFVHDHAPPRVVFGRGAMASAPAEARRLGRRPVVLASPPQAGLAGEVARLLAGAPVVAEAAMHTPVAVTERVAVEVGRLGSDVLVAVGGGSATGLAKALAARTGLPVLAVPTTYAGSEMTSILGETADGRKVTRRDPGVRARTAIYDPDLLRSLPRAAAAASLLNALAHAVEALYAPNRTPLTDAAAAAAVADLRRGLEGYAHSEDGSSFVEAALRGAWLAGVCLDATAMGPHHKICHVLGGLGLPHAETHAAVLPYVLDAILPHADGARRRLSDAFGADPAGAVRRLMGELGLHRSLGPLGLRGDSIPAAADEIASAPYASPRPLGRAEVELLLRCALGGEAPVAA